MPYFCPFEPETSIVILHIWVLNDNMQAVSTTVCSEFEDFFANPIDEAFSIEKINGGEASLAYDWIATNSQQKH